MVSISVMATAERSGEEDSGYGFLLISVRMVLLQLHCGKRMN